MKDSEVNFLYKEKRKGLEKWLISWKHLQLLSSCRRSRFGPNTHLIAHNHLHLFFQPHRQAHGTLTYIQSQHIWYKKEETFFWRKKGKKKGRQERDGGKARGTKNGMETAPAVWEVIFSIKQVCTSGMRLQDKGTVQEKVVVLQGYPSQDVGNNPIC